MACPVSVRAEVRSVSFEQVVLIPKFSGRSNTTLSEVGQLEALRLQGNYDTGQMFLHKVTLLLGQIWENACSLYQVFGYRGVILFPWLARVYDRDMPSKPPNTRSACLFSHTILHRLVVSVQSFHDMWKFQGKTFGHRQSQFLLLSQVFLKSRVAPFYQLNKSNYSAAWLLGEWGRR